MPEMEYTTQALMAQQSAAAARAAEARMRDEGTDVASPPEFDEDEMAEDAEALGIDPEASLDRSGSEPGAMPAASESDSSSSEGDMTSAGSVGGTEVHDSGLQG